MRRAGAEGEEEAFGELNYLKATQEQASFMSVPHNGGFVGRAVHVLRTRAHVPAVPRVAPRECANNEGKFVPRSH